MVSPPPHSLSLMLPPLWSRHFSGRQRKQFFTGLSARWSCAPDVAKCPKTDSCFGSGCLHGQGTRALCCLLVADALGYCLSGTGGRQGGRGCQRPPLPCGGAHRRGGRLRRAFMAFCAQPAFISDAACNQPITTRTQASDRRRACDAPALTAPAAQMWCLLYVGAARHPRQSDCRC